MRYRVSVNFQDWEIELEAAAPRSRRWPIPVAMVEVLVRRARWRAVEAASLLETENANS